jgi:hypothetical protein
MAILEELADLLDVFLAVVLSMRQIKNTSSCWLGTFLVFLSLTFSRGLRCIR